jgi:putative transposase
LKRKPSKREKEDNRLEISIKAAHQRGRGTYGAERIKKELAGEGIEAGVVGYAMSERMTQDTVGKALIRAVKVRKPERGLILHSDRGSQYCSWNYRYISNQFGMIQSMSRKGNFYDNAPIESFWGTLKTELVYQIRYETRAQAIREITEYIEIFYNRQRRHSSLCYVSPAVFLQDYYKMRKAA